MSGQAVRISFIGGGNMGEAILSALLQRKLAAPQSITVSDMDESCCHHLNRDYGVTAVSDNRLAVKGSEVVILAVKPQHLPAVMAELKGSFKTGQLVLSIIAGARIDTLCQGLNHQQVIRSMPNTPARIGDGVTVWTATAGVTAAQKDMARSILQLMGTEIYVEDESRIDMATAISGSGPAYLFLFLEALAEAAEHIGLPPDMAQELALQTVIGAAHLVRQTGQPPAELRRMVTSPGGTTAEALLELEKGNFSDLILRAVTAAHEKARELGRRGC